MARIWLAVCKKEVLPISLEEIIKNYNEFSLCDIHFEPCMFSTAIKNRLLKRALPTIFPEPDIQRLDSCIMEEEITIEEEPIDITYSPTSTAIEEQFPMDEESSSHQIIHSPVQRTREENIANFSEKFDQFEYSPVRNGSRVSFIEDHESCTSSKTQPINTGRRSYTRPCRICLVALDPKKSAPLHDKCHPKKTIKQMIKFCIPHRKFALSDKDFICRKCLRNVRLFVKFIEDFLNVEKKLRERKKSRAIDASTVIFNDFENLVEVQTGSALLPAAIPVNNESHPVINTIDRDISSNSLSAETPASVTDNSINKVLSHEIIRTAEVHTCNDCFGSFRSQFELEDHQKKIHQVEHEGRYDCHNFNLHLTILKDMDSRWLVHNGHYSRSQKGFPKDKIEKHSEKGTYKSDEIYEILESPDEEEIQESKKNENSFSDNQVNNSEKNTYKSDEIYEILESSDEEDISQESIQNKNSSSNDQVEHFENCSYENTGIYEIHESPDEEEISQESTNNKNSRSNDQVGEHKMDQNEAVHICHICGSCFEKISDLQTHMKVHVKRKSLVCDKCQKSFRTLKILKFHKMYSHEKTKSKCKYCGKMMWNYELLAHYRSYHSRKINYFCKICGEDFLRTDLYKNHLRNHLLMDHVKRKRKIRNNISTRGERKLMANKRSRHKCEICSLTFSSPRSRDQHKKLHDDPSQSNRCDICLKVCESQEELAGHIARHGLFTCSYCEEQFTRKDLLDQHIFEYHKKSES